MKFKYEGFNRQAQVVKGEIDAFDAQDAQQQLKQQFIRPRKLTLIKGGASETNTNSISRVTQSGNRSSGFSMEEIFENNKPNLAEFTAFIRQLATMQSSGIPLVQALTLLSEQSENRAFGGVLKAIVQRITEGTGFADALRQYPEIFDKIFVNLVAAGEVSGSLDAILLRMSLYYEKAASLRRRVKSAMTYPIVTLVLVVGVLIGMLLFVVPIFEGMFLSSKKSLPFATQLIVDLSKSFQNHIFFHLSALAATVGLIVYVFRNEEARRALDPFLIEMPVFGKIILKASLARFSRTLGTMLQAGVPFLDALDITARVSGNAVIETAVLKAKESIKEGQGLGATLSQSPIFPKMVVGMVTVGEQTGSLDQMLTKIAEFYEDEVDASVSSLASTIEPLMIIIVGCVVMAFLIPLYLPIFQIGDVIGG
jgi:type IV pilus assembly protein PilC